MSDGEAVRTTSGWEWAKDTRTIVAAISLVIGTLGGGAGASLLQSYITPEDVQQILQDHQELGPEISSQSVVDSVLSVDMWMVKGYVKYLTCEQKAVGEGSRPGSCDPMLRLLPDPERPIAPPPSPRVWRPSNGRVRR